LEDWVFDSQPLSESPWRSLGKTGHLNRPGKNQVQRSTCRQLPLPKSN